MLFADLGFDTPTAVRIFLAKAIAWEGMPFEVAKPRPNAETLKAMLDGMEIIPKRYGSFDEILAEVHAEIAAEESNLEREHTAIYSDE
jgi:addiction module RelB/DinJ family antitoxin